jgi:hypothetical protein
MGAASCNQVLGIEESFVDPSLEGTPGSDSGGKSGAAPKEGDGGERAALGGSSPALGGAEGDGGGGGDSVGGQGGAAASEEDVCDQYCALMSELCVGEALQYKDVAQCLTICRTFPLGEIDDDRVNTASCRRRYAGKARYLAGAELATNCAYAGPGGASKCGSDCEGLCSISMVACGPGVSDPYYYASVDDCLADCAGLPSSRYEYGAISSGGSLECRLFHASSAIMADADEHCEHALGITLCTD